MIFSEDNTQLKVFDWQTLCVSNGFYDVVYLIYMSLSPRDIILCEKDLIQVYLTTLQKEGIVLISKEDSQKMYRAALRWYLGITLGLSLTISSIPKEQRLACNSLQTLYNRCMDSIVALASSEFPTNV